MNSITSEVSGQLIAGLITLFGTLITIILGTISWFIRRYVTQVDVRLKEHEQEIGELKVGQARHQTEIKNIHHRLKEI